MPRVRFPPSRRNVDDPLHDRGVDVSHETVRYRWHRSGPVFAKFNGGRHSLRRAVDRGGALLERFVTKARERKAASKIPGRAMWKHVRPQEIVTDSFGSCGAAPRGTCPVARQETGRWLDVRAEDPQPPFRRRHRPLLRFGRMRSLQKFAIVRASVTSHVNGEPGLSGRSLSRANPAAARAG